VSQIPGYRIIPAPPITPYKFGALAQLDVQTGGPHFGMPVAFESKAGLADNALVTYPNGTTFSPNDKTLDQVFAFAEGFDFQAARLLVGPIPAAGGLEEQNARAAERFTLWESYLVEQQLAAHWDTSGNSTHLGGGAEVEPDEAVAVLLAAISQTWPGEPQIHTGLGPATSIAWKELIDSMGAELIIGRGYGATHSAGVGRMWATPTVHLLRDETINVQAPVVQKNEIWSLVERDYSAYYDGPVYSIDAHFAPSDVS
jgi:hypothetical protein